MKHRETAFHEFILRHLAERQQPGIELFDISFFGLIVAHQQAEEVGFHSVKAENLDESLLEGLGYLPAVDDIVQVTSRVGDAEFFAEFAIGEIRIVSAMEIDGVGDVSPKIAVVEDIGQTGTHSAPPPHSPRRKPVWTVY